MRFSRILFLLGIIIFLYPTISDKWNSYHQSKVIRRYTESAVGIDEEEIEKYFQEADVYNENIAKKGLLGNVLEKEHELYLDILWLSENGIMGYIEIPAIDCRLPIYHGTDETVLQAGAGHMEGSSLPVGGENTHCILAGHRGLPSSRLFTGLDRLVCGDIFRIIVLNKVISYQVEQIQIVLPEDTGILKIEKGKDLCTLVTCTPYGVNTHRLLIQGIRIQETGGDGAKSEKTEEGGKRIPVKNIIKWSCLCILLVLFFASTGKQVRAETADEKSKQEKRYEVEIEYPIPDVEFRLIRMEDNVRLQKGQISQNKKLLFSDVEAGEYLLTGEMVEKEGWQYIPVDVKISIPGESEASSGRILVKPKYEKYQPGTTSETETTETTEEDPGPKKEKTPFLPQTGQVWMPAVLMAVFGVILCLFGWLRRKIDENREK